MPNYITPRGAKKLSEELSRLRSIERPKVVQEVADAAAQGDRSENAEYIYGKKKLREIDRRMHFLTKRLESAHVVDPSIDRGDKIFFGAKVELEDSDGNMMNIQIVGEDEVDSDMHRISWQSPLGKAILGKSVADIVHVLRPAGEIEYEIVAVRYEADNAEN